MRSFEALATIDASSEEIWAVLADSAGWSQWDSDVDGVDGEQFVRGLKRRVEGG